MAGKTSNITAAMTKPLHKQWTNPVSKNHFGLLIEQSATDLQKRAYKESTAEEQEIGSMLFLPMFLVSVSRMTSFASPVLSDWAPLYPQNKDACVAPLSTLTARIPRSVLESPQGARDTPYALKLSVTPFKPLKLPSHLNLLAFSVMTEADWTASH